MAATPDPAKRMEKPLECCFCTRTVTNPRTLSCYHSFCHHCLKRFVAARREDAVKAGTEIPEIFDCPTCRTTFHVKKNESVEKIPLNYFINYEVIFPLKLNYEFCARTLYFDTRIFCENAVLCKPVLCNTVLWNTVLWNTVLCNTVL